jgi:spectinomycin phosphotransferase
MLDDPDLDAAAIAATLATSYGIQAVSVSFQPLGHDPYAAVYQVLADDDTPYFLKIRWAPLLQPALHVPRALIDAGVPNILAPLRTHFSALWCPLDGYDGYSIVLYPFIHGRDAKAVGLSDDQ